MKIFVGYASTEGQTRKICRFVADHLVDVGHSVELLDVDAAEGLDMARFDRVILAGSLHLKRFQSSLDGFVRANAAVLAALPSLFLAVSLAAAGDDAEDWQGLRECMAQFCADVRWQPARVEHVAGAFRFTEYDFFKSLAMRYVARQRGQVVDPHADREYTDWAALAAALDDWLGGSA
ncbi:MAG: menaquinone-dependent protoporphyrinogen oxidase [Cypionkella sp.]|uniref:flavodoxin domain-containing protein n=1 Tax=Cypionkella sp. TaxID=2811411 RepID=UPI002628E80C|nr:flavodoxin domain-containing protein [Cypionkella sp.]MDB5660597.1 menaquinone-dependent protoporphyrinogen oxidase [Cypionkella sp.]